MIYGLIFYNIYAIMKLYMTEKPTFNQIFEQHASDPTTEPTVLVEHEDGTIHTARLSPTVNERNQFSVTYEVEEDEVSVEVHKPVSRKFLSDEGQAKLAEALGGPLGHDEIEDTVERVRDIPAEVVYEAGEGALELSEVVRPENSHVAILPSLDDILPAVEVGEQPEDPKEAFLSREEINRLGGFMHELGDQSRVARSRGPDAIMHYDGMIASWAHNLLEGLEKGRESSASALVTMSTMLGALTDRTQREAVFGMIQRSKTLSDGDMKRLGEELQHLASLDHQPGQAADDQKAAYANHLNSKARNMLVANNHVPDDYYISTLALTAGVGMRMDNRLYGMKLAEDAFKAITETKK